MEEIEVKFLDIDPEGLQVKLKEIGAKKVGEYFYRRQIFDYSDLRLHKDAAWLRLRDEGDKVTLSFKRRMGAQDDYGKINDEGMEEIEVVVSDFEKTGLILLRLGMTEKYYQENKRIRWVKDDIEFDFDFWPRLKPYLEIEGPSYAAIDKAIDWLGLDPNDKKIFSANQVYKLNGINELDYQRMTFEEFTLKNKD